VVRAGPKWKYLITFEYGSLIQSSIGCTQAKACVRTSPAKSTANVAKIGDGSATTLIGGTWIVFSGGRGSSERDLAGLIQNYGNGHMTYQRPNSSSSQ
jgi:hypothetical protein